MRLTDIRSLTKREVGRGRDSTLTLEEKDGKTTLIMHQPFPSKEALDRDISGMEHGLRETLTQLEELLAATKKIE